MRMVLLYDFYQGLLTEKQRYMMDLYYQQDFSLAEIAEILLVSRQAVYDHLKRTENILEKHEKNMKLIEKYFQQQKIIKNIEEKIGSCELESVGTELSDFLDELKELLKQL